MRVLLPWMIALVAVAVSVYLLTRPRPEPPPTDEPGPPWLALAAWVVLGTSLCALLFHVLGIEL